jgi:hypothetical protein
MNPHHVLQSAPPCWHISKRAPAAPLVAVALHDGHEVSESALGYFLLDDAERRREEDPCTAAWVDVAPYQVVAHVSRFEVDLNREREEAVYREPEQAWGLHVWRTDTPGDLWNDSLALHDSFYREVAELLDDVVARHGRFVLYDLHTYNHRRAGPSGPTAEPEANPEINVGTRALDRRRWAPVIEAFMQDLRAFDFAGRHLDVRENVKFGGGAFARWVAGHYPTGCPLAIEIKKFFMDEWTGKVDIRQVALLRAALAATVDGVLAALEQT